MSNIDILPTLVELTGAPHPQLPIDGLSMAAILKGTNKAPIRQSLCMYYHRNSLQAITDGYYKLVFPINMYPTKHKCQAMTDNRVNWVKKK